jgi:hypothetical protein
MTWWLLANGGYDKYLVVFANTGQENEATLEFIRNCDRHFGFGTVWIEAVQFHDQRQSPGHRIVTFDTADREGAVFEDAIRKYGIPNHKFKDCTRNLKSNPLAHYARSAGWEPASYDLAIGIRADEIDRMSSGARARRIVYPLIQKCPMTKIQINTWWARQPFRLQLKGYQGNCKWCWKKSFRKHFTIIDETPEVYDFPRRMEQTYGRQGPEFRKMDPAAPIPDSYRRTFFRGNKSVGDLFDDRMFLPPDFKRADDDAQVFDADMDVGAGCEESCEVFADEDELKLTGS